MLFRSQAQAVELEFASAEPAWKSLTADAVNKAVMHLSEQILELEYTLIPYGLHILGSPISAEQSLEMLMSYASVQEGQIQHFSKESMNALMQCDNLEQFAKDQKLSLTASLKEELNQALNMYRDLQSDSEMQGIFKALD